MTDFTNSLVRINSERAFPRQKESVNETKNIRACIYVRTARKRQDSDYVQQIKNCSQYIAQRDWTLNGIFLDEGVSGRAVEKPELSLMLEMAAKGSFDIVVVSNIDRLSRSTTEIVEVAKILQDFHVALRSVNEPEMALFGLKEFTRFS